jgi:hypothetical protein
VVNRTGVYKTKDVADIKNRIIWANYTDRSALDHDIEWLCCKNVMVNLRTGEVRSHSPEFMATIRIPHEYPCIKYPLCTWACENYAILVSGYGLRRCGNRP